MTIVVYCCSWSLMKYVWWWISTDAFLLFKRWYCNKRLIGQSHYDESSSWMIWRWKIQRSGAVQMPVAELKNGKQLSKGKQPPLTHTHAHTQIHALLLHMPHRWRLETPEIQRLLWLASETMPPGWLTPCDSMPQWIEHQEDMHTRMLEVCMRACVCDWYSLSLYGYISLWNTSFPWREHLWGSASGGGIPIAQQHISTFFLDKKTDFWRIITFLDGE